MEKLFYRILCMMLAMSATATWAGGLDYDGDGRDDTGAYNPSAGLWYIYRSAYNDELQLQWGNAQMQPAIGDFDGDGKNDICAYEASTGNWYIFRSSNLQPMTFTLGGTDDRPVAADYDGDGTTDVAVFNRNTATWRIRQSGLGGAIRTVVFGWFEAKPVPADYDGDGQADLAVFHPPSGTWYLSRSLLGPLQRQFGNVYMRPVPGDYDGDGKADLAMYERTTGKWHVLRSQSGSYLASNWGFFKARAIPGDYDGDGRTDLAVYERATAKWSIAQSGNPAPRAFNYGWSTTTPLSSYQHGGIEGATILFFGDSITYGRGSSNNGPPTGYPERLVSLLGPALGGHFHVVNAGLPGETTSQGRSRIGSLLSTHKPNLTLLMEGTNDHVFQYSFASIEANLRDMIAQIRSRGSQVVLGNTPPVSTYYDSGRATQASRIRAFNPTQANIAASLGVPMASVYESLANVANWPTALYAPQSANHPNDAGYQRVAEEYLRTVRNAYRDGVLD